MCFCVPCFCVVVKFFCFFIFFSPADLRRSVSQKHITQRSPGAHLYQRRRLTAGMWQPILAPAGLDPTAGAANGRTSEAADDGRNGRRAGSAGRVSAAVLLVHSPQTVFIAPRSPPTHPPQQKHTHRRTHKRTCLTKMLFEMGNNAAHQREKKLKQFLSKFLLTLKWHTSDGSSSLLANSFSVRRCITQPIGHSFFDHQLNNAVFSAISINGEKKVISCLSFKSEFQQVQLVRIEELKLPGR